LITTMKLINLYLQVTDTPELMYKVSSNDEDKQQSLSTNEILPILATMPNCPEIINYRRISNVFFQEDEESENKKLASINSVNKLLQTYKISEDTETHSICNITENVGNSSRISCLVKEIYS